MGKVFAFPLLTEFSPKMQSMVGIVALYLSGGHSPTIEQYRAAAERVREAITEQQAYLPKK